MLAILGGCATSAAPDFGGDWTPANRYPETTEALPLHAQYRYQATPMDRTLRTMLARWASETGRRLDYRHASDFTLHAPAARIQATELEAALAQVSAVYALEGVLASVDGRAIVISPRIGMATPQGQTASPSAQTTPAPGGASAHD